MNYFYPGGFNPNVGLDPQLKIEELQRQLAALQQTQAQMFGPPPRGNVAQGNGAVRQYETGIYVYVSDYQEVLDYPTPSDGSAVLFVCLEKGLGWSKKFVNGTSSIQALTINFLNSYDQSTQAPVQPSQEGEKASQYSNGDIVALLGTLSDRITALEENRGGNNAMGHQTNDGRGQNDRKPSTSNQQNAK